MYGRGNAQRIKCLSTNIIFKHKWKSVGNSLAARYNGLLTEEERHYSCSLRAIKLQLSEGKDIC
jgi:hypothetical protein